MIRAYDDYGNAVDLVKWENEIYNKALEDLERVMYQKSFRESSEMQKWDSGCWIRYKLFENCVEQLKKGKIKWQQGIG